MLCRVADQHHNRFVETKAARSASDRQAKRCEIGLFYVINSNGEKNIPFPRGTVLTNRCFFQTGGRQKSKAVLPTLGISQNVSLLCHHLGPGFEIHTTSPNTSTLCSSQWSRCCRHVPARSDRFETAHWRSAQSSETGPKPGLDPDISQRRCG